jgi:glutathione S-transferase/RNA polymerase-associated protein
MTLRLFEHPLSPYARKWKIVAYEKGVPFERLFVNPIGPASDPGRAEFARISPRLEVPCLVDGPLAIFDSTVMLEYLDEKWPEKPSLPASPAERARVRMLEEVCDGELEAVNWGVMEIRFFRRAEGARAESMLGQAASQLERLWGRLERELDGREWMNGERFGRGDAAVIPHIAGSSLFGFTLPDRFPKLHAWFARCATRESVARDAAEVSAWVRENLAGGAAGGAGAMPVVRQYRDHRLEWMMKSGGVEVVLRGLENGTIRFAQEVR